jgi:mono/diheme cytochrome c family protein
MKKSRILSWPFMVVAGVVFVTAAIGVAMVALYLMFSGPRMRIQPKYPAYQAQMPPAPEGIVPVWQPSRVALVPEDILLENPLPDAEKTRAAGRVYYGYYCAFCHGGPGEVTGPVGRSYVPAPPRLTRPEIQGMSDGELYWAMLTGIGHEPVLEYVIDAQTRWYIVSYVRTLGSESP